MPPKNKKTATGVKSAKAKDTGLDTRSPPGNEDYMKQTYKEYSDRCVAFIHKLLGRLSAYEEDVDKFNDAFTNNTDLPPPKLTKAAATKSQPENDDDSSRQRKELEALKKQQENSKTEITTLEAENAWLQLKITKCEKEKEDIQQQLGDRNKELHEELTSIKRDLDRQRLENDDDSSRQKKELEALKKQQENSKTEITTLEAENAWLQLKITKCEKEKEDIQQQLGDRNKELHEELTSIKRDLDRQRLKKQEDEIRKLRKENADMKTGIKELERLQKLKPEPPKDSHGKKKGGGKADDTSYEAQIKKLEDEVEGLRNRLSTMAGTQLTDSNHGIRDLSDPNRPLSLAEKFSELFDNEWTDAMEEMSDTMTDETKVIKLLLDIVCDAYTFCLHKSDTVMDVIKSTLNGFSMEFSSYQNMPKEFDQTNTDYRKRLAVHVVKYIEQDFAKEMRIKMKTNVGTKTEAYMKRCVSVCWFMTVQDPQVVITTKPPAMFDEDLYKPYTKKGKRLDYLVWPVLHLHEGGPLLSKGVAQGK